MTVKVQLIAMIEVPKKVWVCHDCGTVSNDKTAGRYHTGHVGHVADTNKSFIKLKMPVLDVPSGEVIWVWKYAPVAKPGMKASDIVKTMKGGVKEDPMPSGPRPS